MADKSAVLATIWAMIGIFGTVSHSGAKSLVKPTENNEMCVTAQHPDSMLRDGKDTVRAAARHWPRWLYNEAEDEVEGRQIRYAELVSASPNAAAFGRDGPKLVLTLRRGGPQEDVMLTLSEDQFDCPGSACKVKVQFDEGELQTYAARPAHNSVRALTLIDNEQTFVQHIQQANTLLLKADLRVAADCEFVFHTAGLRWP